MPRFTVHMQPLITVEVETDDPLGAAQFARDRVLGLLRETPAAIQSIGFMPDYPWSVRCLNRDVARGVDNDLSPRTPGAMSGQ